MKFHPDNLLDVLVSPFNLRFSDEDEREFRAAQNADIRKHLSIVLFGILFFALTLLILGAGPFSSKGLWIGIGFISAALGMLAIAGDARHSQLLVATGSLAFQLAMFWSVLSSEAFRDRHVTYGFLVAGILAHYVVLRLRFIPALISGVMAFFGLVLFLVSQKTQGFESPLYIATICNMLGIFSAQRLEVMRRMNFLAIRNIEAEQAKTQSLLRKIIPDHLVEKFLESSDTGSLDFCNQVEGSAVLFIELMNCGVDDRRNLFRIYDSIVRRASLEKIKTVENKMIIAGGLFDSEKSVENIINVAIRMRSEITQYNLDKDLCLGFRASISYGTVSSGIVGTKAFAFDIWGLPVNLASRILRLTPDGDICVSESFRSALPEAYQFSSIGLQSLKGLGKSEIFKLDTFSFSNRFPMKEVA